MRSYSNVVSARYLCGVYCNCLSAILPNHVHAIVYLSQGHLLITQYETRPFITTIDKSEATKRSTDRKIYGKFTNGTKRRSRVWPVCFNYIFENVSLIRYELR